MESTLATAIKIHNLKTVARLLRYLVLQLVAWLSSTRMKAASGLETHIFIYIPGIYWVLNKCMLNEWMLHSVVFVIRFLALITAFSCLRLLSWSPPRTLWPPFLKRALFSLASYECPSEPSYWSCFHSQDPALP